LAKKDPNTNAYLGNTKKISKGIALFYNFPTQNWTNGTETMFWHKHGWHNLESEEEKKKFKVEE
jgi:hypothetical protein